MFSSPFKNRLLPILSLVTSAILVGCGSSTPRDAQATSASTPEVEPTSVAATPSATPGSSVRFVDVTQEAGLRLRHHTGAFGIKLMPETMGSGVAFLDFDGDGDQDLYFVNGRDWTREEVEQYRAGKWSQDEKTVFFRHNPPGTPQKRKVPPMPARRKVSGVLYRNNGNGTWTDVTRGSGLEAETYGMGAAVGDYDNDGRVDLYVTGLGRNLLFRNLGSGRFEEVGQSAGVRDAGWSTSAAWLDYDKDGRLDLFVCHYVKWTPALDRYGTMNGRDKSYTAPFFYEGEANRLFRNLGGGRFADVSDKAGVALVPSAIAGEVGQKVPGRSLGVAVCDYNNDGWPDIMVANDGDQNFLLRNNRKGTFTEVGTRSNVAFNEKGETRGGMGVDTADINHTNRDSIAVGNFDNEMIALYLNRSKELFLDVAPLTAIGRASRKHSVFGLAFLDVDNDGWADLFTASGHIDEQIEGIRGTSYALRPLLFLNDGKGNFSEVGAQSGEALTKPRVARGLAYADTDLDGDLDLVMTTSGGPPVLLRNDGGNKQNAIRIELRGVKSNRSGIGTLIKLPDEKIRAWVRSGSSYLSQSELPVTVGLGAAKSVREIHVVWPSGLRQTLKNVGANQSIVVREGQGIIAQKPLARS